MKSPELSYILENAACARTDNPELFFPPKGATRQADLAKKVCKECVVRDACLQKALELDSRDDRDGIFGGTTPGQRAKLEPGPYYELRKIPEPHYKIIHSRATRATK